jgi:hypothetical protein
LGNAGKDIFKEIGIQIGNKVAQETLERLSGQIITKINQAVGFWLLTKFGQTGVINLGKGVPIIGVLIGATLDLLSTDIIGNVARGTFIEEAVKTTVPMYFSN